MLSNNNLISIVIKYNNPFFKHSFEKHNLLFRSITTINVTFAKYIQDLSLIN